MSSGARSVRTASASFVGRGGRFGALRDAGSTRAPAAVVRSAVMTDPSAMEAPPVVVNVDDVPEIGHPEKDHWGAPYKPLTPALDARRGRLGANVSRVEKGRTACPFHSHQREDEVFFVLSGRGVLRYGERMMPLRQGDCVSCPAGTGIAHQIANPYDEDLVYLAVGRNDPDEVCVYPDSGKVMVRSLKRVGWLAPVDYMDGEPDRPKILDLIASTPDPSQR